MRALSADQVACLLFAAGVAGTSLFAIKASIAKKRLERTVDRLIDGLARQAGTAAMGGNQKQAEAFVLEAEEAGADPVSCANLRGVGILLLGPANRSRESPA